MDFASLMNAQINSARPATSDTTAKKYLKRSEIEAQRQADYEREQEQLEQARLDRLEKKRKREEEDAERTAALEAKKRRLAEQSRKLREEEEAQEEAARRKRLGLPELQKTDLDGSKEGTPVGEPGDDVPEEELRSMLKDLGEPRMLFGESHVQRLRRYRKLTAVNTAQEMTKGPIPTTLELVPEKDMKVPSIVPKDIDGRKLLFRQLASYFDMLLSEWQLALSRRSKEVKESFSGRQAVQSFTAARDNLRPLFRRLEASFASPQPQLSSSAAKNVLPDSLLSALLEIAHLAQLKRYVNANDAYLRLSIGKAAWPIGVTMVGIHERSAREKLHETDKDKEAHILADEATRKMLQGIKRCLSFAQTRWPPDDLGQLMG